MAKVNLDVANRWDITCRKGDTFQLVSTVKDGDGVVIDLSSYTFKMQVRENDTDGNIIIDDGSITKTGTSLGALTITIQASVMAAIAADTYVYDVEAISGTKVTTWLQGLFVINEDVTV
jgi:hypothetical protein